MYSYKELTKLTRKMTLKQLKFFYNTVFGHNGFFTYVENLNDLEQDLEEVGEDILDYDLDNKTNYIWKDGYVVLLTSDETKEWILANINEASFNVIDSFNHDCLSWVNGVYYDSINYC